MDSVCEFSFPSMEFVDFTLDQLNIALEYGNGQYLTLEPLAFFHPWSKPRIVDCLYTMDGLDVDTMVECFIMEYGLPFYPTLLFQATFGDNEFEKSKFLPLTFESRQKV